MGTAKPHLFAGLVALVLAALAGVARSDLATGSRANAGAIVATLTGPAPVGLELVAAPFAGRQATTTSFARFGHRRARLDPVAAGVHHLYLRRPLGPGAGMPLTLWIPVETPRALPTGSKELSAEVGAWIAGFMRAWRAQDVASLASFYHPDYRGASGADLAQRVRELRATGKHTEILSLEHRVLAVGGPEARVGAWVETVSVARDRATGRSSARRALFELEMRRGADGGLSILSTRRGWLPPEAIDPATRTHYAIGSRLASVEVAAGSTVRIEIDPQELK